MGRKSDARQRLIDAAHELIWEFSYGAVTIDAICERAGVKKGSFYYFFESKPDLAIVSIDTWWLERKALISHAFRPEVPPLERIRSYLDFVSQRQIQFYESNGQVLGCPIFNLGAEICTQDERIRGRIRTMLAWFLKCFEEAITEAQESGQIKCRNAKLQARSLFSFYEGVLTQARIENNPESIVTLSADALELLGAQPAVKIHVPDLRVKAPQTRSATRTESLVPSISCSV